MAWHLAPSLVRLQKDLDAEFGANRPNDGTVGDLAHAARASEHNPDRDADGMPAGAVSAIDVYTEANGKTWITAAEFAKLLAVFKKDARVWYVIHKGYIYSVKHGWAKTKYTGANPHNTHIHLSLVQSKAAHDNDASWELRSVRGGADPKPSTGGTVKPYPVLSRGDSEPILVPFLKRYFDLDHINDNPLFGAGTELAVVKFQKRNGLVADGVVGKLTWAAIKKGGTLLPPGYAA